MKSMLKAMFSFMLLGMIVCVSYNSHAAVKEKLKTEVNVVKQEIVKADLTSFSKTTNYVVVDVDKEILLTYKYLLVEIHPTKIEPIKERQIVWRFNKTFVTDTDLINCNKSKIDKDFLMANSKLSDRLI
jgi:hypothetical protein